jgi:hypothetical protein
VWEPGGESGSGMREEPEWNRGNRGSAPEVTAAGKAPAAPEGGGRGAAWTGGQWPSLVIKGNVTLPESLPARTDATSAVCKSRNKRGICARNRRLCGNGSLLGERSRKFHGMPVAEDQSAAGSHFSSGTTSKWALRRHAARSPARKRGELPSADYSAIVQSAGDTQPALPEEGS